MFDMFGGALSPRFYLYIFQSDRIKKGFAKASKILTKEPSVSSLPYFNAIAYEGDRHAAKSNTTNCLILLWWTF